MVAMSKELAVKVHAGPCTSAGLFAVYQQCDHSDA